MPDIICTTVYQFPELSDAAKERARSWYREAAFHDDWWDAVYDDFERVCDILGVSLNTRVRQADGWRHPAETLHLVFGVFVAGGTVFRLRPRPSTPRERRAKSAPMPQWTKPCTASPTDCGPSNGRISISSKSM